ncbi:CDP-diacylglycerol diphosphatase [Mycobacterium sp. shizuoka-1]|uniref:CDP-diacylglycerol diphosphatase n=1 Tax=Mycobacterium sp. shizuoka-1 TaxID=2039281 RepID=UPI000C061EA4|nr:CDP-diacylglycerol diphosphatase [Mycobacterium sp. shizuoka-1]GAY17890.1 CDP-diacylglycerol pyrophosphatase [Mycobacterium sp. shizuoka-1]
MRYLRGCAPLAAALMLGLTGPATATADPDALWRIVHDGCVVDETQHHDPAPCSRVDLTGGESAGYVVFKDQVGERQYLVMPTARIAGMESPELLDPGTTNYFAAAWQARAFVEQRAGGTIPRDWMSLAVNSAASRTQNQLHIHLDCLRADVHDALRSVAGAIGPVWAPVGVPLSGRSYWAIAVDGPDLVANPFIVLADGLPGARTEMGLYTLVVVGTTAADGRPGFVILADRADAAGGAAGEELQDHDTCPAPVPPTPATAK